MLTGPDELMAAAEVIADQFPGPAAELRMLAIRVMDPDPRQIRRMILRRIWRTHHRWMTRTAAARLIAAEWRAWADNKNDDLPDTLGDAFSRLGRAGIGPVAYRTILDDLDESLD